MSNEYQTFNLIFGAPLTYCIETEANHGKDKEKVQKCYYKFLPEARALCKPQLDEVVEWCGAHGRVHPECHTVWRLLQRCLHSNGYWEEELHGKPPKR